MAAYGHKNQRNNVEKISHFLKPSLKLSPILPRSAPIMIESIYYRLATFIVPRLECSRLHGVDIL